MSEETDRASLDAFTLALRVMFQLYAGDSPASEFERPWVVLREIANGETTLSSPGELAARFPRMSEFVYDTANQVIDHDRRVAERVLRGLAGAFGGGGPAS